LRGIPSNLIFFVLAGRKMMLTTFQITFLWEQGKKRKKREKKEKNRKKKKREKNQNSS